MSINPKYIQENPPSGPARETGQNTEDRYCMTAVRRIETFLGIVEPLMDHPRFANSLRNDIHVGFAPVPTTGGHRFFMTNLKTSDLGGGLSFDFEKRPDGSALYTFKYVNTRTHRESQVGVVKKHPAGKIWGYTHNPDAWDLDNNEIEIFYLLDEDPKKVVTHDGNQYKIGTSPNVTWDMIDSKLQEVNHKKLFLYLSGILNRTVIIPYYQKHNLDIRGDRLEQNKLLEILHRLKEKLSA